MSFFVRIVRNLAYPKYRNHRVVFNFTKRLQNFRNFHCSANVCAKMFMEHENKYAYSILENKGYAVSLNNTIQQQTLSDEQFQELMQTDWSGKPHTEIIQLLPKLGVYCTEHKMCISDTVFDEYIDSLTESMRQATDKELEFIFYALNFWPEPTSIRLRNYIEVWVALDDECLNRIKSWTHDEMLSYVSLFYMINVIRYSDFTNKSLQKLASKAKQLTTGQLVQSLFFVGIWRKSPFDMHNFEIELNNKYSQFTIDDLAIMCMGFFKSKTPVRDMSLVHKMVNSVIENSKTIHEVSLAAFLKLIRYSMKLTLDNRIYRLLDVLQHEVPRLSVMCNVHMALIGTSTLTLHEDCLNKIAETVSKSMSQTRIKDLERLVLTYGTFNMFPQTEECFLTKVMDELRKPDRISEINKHGRSFACCIAYLALLGIYPVDLIDKALSPELREQTYGKYCYNYGREMLTLNNVAEIFCTHAKMNRLNEKEVKVIAKKYTDYVPSEDFKKKYNITEAMVLDIMKVLKEDRGGIEYVIGEHILSHHQRGDIIICNDANSGAPIAVKDKFNNKDFGLLRRPPDNNVWVALVVAGRNALIYGTDNSTGFFISKVRELETLGYHAALVPWSQYSKLTTAEEKSDYLNHLINNSIRKIK